MMSLTIVSGALVVTLAAAAAVLLRSVQYGRVFSAQPYRYLARVMGAEPWSMR
jgi:hypothetical protein